MTLAEKGEYKCKACSATIAQYRRFETAEQAPAQNQEPKPATAEVKEAPAAQIHSTDDYLTIESLVGMSAYDGEAMLMGRIQEIGLRRSAGDARITLKVGDKEIPWNSISKIGDIVLVRQQDQKTSAGGKCPSCGFQNESDSAFCGECGTNL